MPDIEQDNSNTKTSPEDKEFIRAVYRNRGYIKQIIEGTMLTEGFPIPDVDQNMLSIERRWAED